MATEYLTLMAIGLVGGLAGGLLGIGGSVVMIPGMSLCFGPDQHLYQGAAMMVNFFVVLPAILPHLEAGAVLRPIVRRTIPFAIVGVVVGVWASSGWWFRGTNEIWLSRIFGLFLFYVAGYNIYRLFRTRPLPDVDAPAARKLSGWRIALLVGLPTGLLGGLLGIGGGAIAVPLQQLVLRIPLRRAIANSAVTILPLSFAGAIYKNITNAQAGIPFVESFRLAAFLVPTAIVGGYLGGKLTHLVGRRWLRLAFTLLMIYAGYSLVTRSEGQDDIRRPAPIRPSRWVDRSALPPAVAACLYGSGMTKQAPRATANRSHHNMPHLRA